ncbi:MAG: 4Fe-4S dicluster domain-containing protein [Desulfurococcaceae archaeon]
MDNAYFMGDEEALNDMISSFRKRGWLTLGYKLENGRVVFGDVRSTMDLPLNVEDYVEPGSFWRRAGGRFRHTYHSPKTYLHPPRQVLALESKDFTHYEEPSYDVDNGVVLLGVKPCDLEAMRVLDGILLGKHPVYTARRRSVVAVVVEECLEPNNNCFCAVTNTGPTARGEFDIAYARLSHGKVLFKPGSKLGEEVVGELGLQPASRDLLEEYRRSVEQAVETMKRRLEVNLEKMQKLLLRSARNRDLWIELSSRCVGCGNCNYVCPTCFCLEVDYTIENSKAAKVAKWTGCLLYTYGQLATMHVRPELYMRYRHFVLHKFVFYPIQVGRVGCVGCGRCITWCPMGIDLRSTVKKITEVEK